MPVEKIFYAAVVKLADTPALGAGSRKGVKVQVLSAAPKKKIFYSLDFGKIINELGISSNELLK